MIRVQRSMIFTAIAVLLMSVAVGCGAQRGQRLFQERERRRLDATAPPSPPITGLRFADVNGRAYGDATILGSKATVFCFVSTQCPIASLYSTRIAELARTFAGKSVRLFIVDSNGEDSVAALKRYVTDRGLTTPIVKDRGTVLADRLDAETTPEAVVLDDHEVVRYRGRIDDNRDRTKVVRHDLYDALAAVTSGKPVQRPRTLAFGCAIFREHLSLASAGAGAVTYAKDVAPILYKSCATCHRPGETAPFSLLTYQQAKTWASAIRDYSARRLMPPWRAVSGHGEFRDTLALSDPEIATLARWVALGAPEGDPKLTPPAPTFPDPAAWSLGEPDMIVQASRAFHVAADGDDVYREFVMPVDFGEDRYITGCEFKPDNRAIVHHMILYVDPSGYAAQMDGQESEPGYTVPGASIGVAGEFVDGWAPGHRSWIFPDGCAFKIPAGAKLVLQVHYHKDGKAETDRSRVGLHFAKGPVRNQMLVAESFNPQLDLKPNVANQEVHGRHTFSHDVHVYSIAPHMHLLGREMKVVANLPDGSTRDLIWVRDWDFNWQDTYRFKEPVALPKGTRISITGIYDNTESNPRQPNHPPREVWWGEQTTDEMLFLTMHYTLDNPADMHASR